MWRRSVAVAFTALLFGDVQGCVVGGPKPEDFAEMIHRLPTVPVCQHRYEGPATVGPRRGVVSCEGDARVEAADLRKAGLAEARSMNPDRAFVVLTEVINPVDEFGVQCDAVPIIPWSRAGLLDRRLKRRVCTLVPAGPRGHSLEVVVQFGSAPDVRDGISTRGNPRPSFQPRHG
jgi:hypothetical protein